MYSRRVIVCDGGMVKKTLSFIGAVVVRKQKNFIMYVIRTFNDGSGLR